MCARDGRFINSLMDLHTGPFMLLGKWWVGGWVEECIQYDGWVGCASLPTGLQPGALASVRTASHTPNKPTMDTELSLHALGSAFRGALSHTTSPQPNPMQSNPTQYNAIQSAGPTMDPKVASELSLRIPHLSLRIREHSARALLFAERLEALGAKVSYPGLPSHPQHALLRSLVNPGACGGARAHVVACTRGGVRMEGPCRYAG